MRTTLRTELGSKFMYEPYAREWLEDGNSLEIYFRDLEDDVWQGNTVIVHDCLRDEDVAIEVCAVRRTLEGFRVYVLQASAVAELEAAVRG